MNWGYGYIMRKLLLYLPHAVVVLLSKAITRMANPGEEKPQELL
jgi:hypothetical protein